MFTFFLLLLSLFGLSRSSINCPKDSWTEYKTIKDGFWQLTIPDNKEVNVSFNIERKTEYRCSNNETGEFRTNRNRYFYFNRVGYYMFRATFLKKCIQECNRINGTIKLLYRDRNRSVWFGWSSSWSEWSEWKPLGKIVYLKKKLR